MVKIQLDEWEFTLHLIKDDSEQIGWLGLQRSTVNNQQKPLIAKFKNWMSKLSVRIVTCVTLTILYMMKITVFTAKIQPHLLNII